MHPHQRMPFLWGQIGQELLGCRSRIMNKNGYFSKGRFGLPHHLGDVPIVGDIRTDENGVGAGCPQFLHKGLRSFAGTVVMHRHGISMSGKQTGGGTADAARGPCNQN